MYELSIIIKEFTNKLNNVVEEIQIWENDDDKMPMLFSVV